MSGYLLGDVLGVVVLVAGVIGAVALAVLGAADRTEEDPDQ